MKKKRKKTTHRRKKVSKTKRNGARDRLAKDTVDNLSDLMEDDPEFRVRLLNAAMRRKDFRRRVVECTIKQMT